MMFTNTVPSSDLMGILSPYSYTPEILRFVHATNGDPMLSHYLARPPRLGVTGPIEYAYVDEGTVGAVPYITTKQLKGLIVRPEECKFIVKEADAQWAKCRIENDDILLNKSGDVGAAGILRTGKYHHCNSVSDIINIRVKRTSGVDPYYLVLFLNSPWGQSQLQQLSGGAVFNHVSIYAIPNIRLRLPSPDIQRTIGNKVRKAERLRELAVAEMRRMEGLLAEILGHPPVTHSGQKAFWTDNALSPYRLNPTEYHPYRLCAELVLADRFSSVWLGSILKNGSGISGGATPLGACYLKAGVGFLRVQNILPNRLDLSDLVFIDDKTDEQLKRSRIRPYDIVLTITGYPGTACCVQATDLPLNINQHSVRFAVRGEWNPFYVAAFLNSPWGKLQIQRRAIGGTREALDYPSIRSLLIPQIDSEKQQAIGDSARDYAQFIRESTILVQRAKDNVDELLSGKLNQSEAIREGVRIDSWLAANPSPSIGGAA